MLALFRKFNYLAVFLLFWLALFLLYYPAARAGWVSDTLGWLEAVRRQSFTDFIAREGFSVRSFYQLTQIITWCFYQIFGANRWAWHLLHLSLHALNATLLYTLIRNILNDSRIEKANAAGFVAAALFCTSPYVSEVIVWEAAYHFLQGMLFLLVQAHLLRRYLHTGKAATAVNSVILFTAATFSLELFFLTPALGLILCAYYRFGLNWERRRARKAFWQIVAPQAVILLLHLAGVRLFFGTQTGRLGNVVSELSLKSFAVKPPENLFHLFGGRFFPQGLREAVYDICSSYAGAAIFYGMLFGCLVWILIRFRQMSVLGKAICLAYLWLLLTLAFVSPLWFPQRLRITGDRYLYALLPPFFLLVTLMALRWVKQRTLQQVLATAFLLFQLPLTYGLSKTWNEAEAFTDQLQRSLTPAQGRLTILLNNPASLRGAPMIGAGADGEAQLMHNLLYAPPILTSVADAPALHLISVQDSIRIDALDSRTMLVRLTRPGAFWQWGSDIARSFRTPDYEIFVMNANLGYTLRLSRPVAAYRLLFQKDGEWHEYHLSRPVDLPLPPHGADGAIN